MNKMKEVQAASTGSQDINDQNRQEIKIHLLELREKNSYNRYQNLLVQMSDMDDQIVRFKNEIKVFRGFRNKNNALWI
jgi:hypothetical protein